MFHWFFIFISVLFSILYARIEAGLDKFWDILGEKDSFWRDIIWKYSQYHLFMLSLGIIVNLPALYFTKSLSFFIALLLMFPLIEDAAYFLWLKKWIKEDDWTAKEGYIKIANVVIPYWYIIAGLSIVLLLAVS